MRQGSFFLAIPAVAMVLTIATLVRSESAPQVASHLSPPPTTRPDRFAADITPSLKKYCYECHGDGEDQGKLKLDSYKSTADMLADKARWEKVLRYVRTQTMPPPEADQHPSQPQRDQLIRAIQRELYQLDPAHPDPGRVTIRRLNRVEYRNTIHDLTAVSFDPSIDFPQDDTGYGFDNIADLLTLPPMLMEKYLSAAEKIMDEAVPTEAVESHERHFLASEVRTSFSFKPNAADHLRSDGFLQLSSTDEDYVSVRGDSPALAEYNVRVLAYAIYPAPPPPGSTDNPPMKLSLMRDNAVVREIEVNADVSQPHWYETRMALPAGRCVVRAAVRRVRGMQEDRKPPVHGRLGREQPGSVAVKEIVIDGPIAGAVQEFAGDHVEIGGAARRGEDGVVTLFRTDDEARVDLDVAAAGNYALRAQATADRSGAEPAKLELRIDGKPAQAFDITAPSGWKETPQSRDLSDRARRPVPYLYEVQARLTPGRHRLTYRFINNLKTPDDPDPNYRDRNIYIEHIEAVELSAPPGSRPMTAPMRELFARHPKPADAHDLLNEFASRAWRRPAHQDEVDRLMSLYALASGQGQGYHASVAHAMKAILVSPQFLFRGETDAQAHHGDATSYPIDEFELASRLSYFLWSTTPDDELLNLAGKNELRRNLDAQVKRMIASPRSHELSVNFAGQWLQFRNLDAAHPDRQMFENYDDRLRDDMQKETTLFFESIVHDDHSLLDVLTADYSYLNDVLAKHYGIDGVSGGEFRRVSLTGTPRRGVLTQGSVLTLTSNPTRTSPVKRGKWVLQNLLGVEPLPPPQVVPALDGQSHHDIANLTLRQRMEKHRADPTCASCHAPMDPIGFALENFDAIGAFRTKDAATGDKIDASAEFPDGSKFTGAPELVTLLAKTRREDFLRGATEAAMVFALGRGIEPYDQPAVDKIVDDLDQHDGRFSTLVLGVVHSAPFQMRRSERGSE